MTQNVEMDHTYVAVLLKNYISSGITVGIELLRSARRGALIYQND